MPAIPPLSQAGRLKDAHGKRFTFPTEPGAPNLDAQTHEDLMTFWAITRSHPVIVARQLFPDRPKGYVQATYLLAGYASNKATAMRCRAGVPNEQAVDIPAALVYEQCCELCYDRLPEFARW